MIVAVGLRACIDRLLAGDVRTTDLHKLFFDLREEVGGKGIISEIGDFIAHPRVRTQGIVFQEVRDAVAGMRLRAILKNQKKVVTTDMPANVPDLLRANFRRMRPAWLKEAGTKPAEAKRMLDGILSRLVPTSGGWSKLLSMTEAERRLLACIGSRVKAGPVLTDDDLFAELARILVRKGFMEHSEVAKFKRVKPAISLYALTVMHNHFELLPVSWTPSLGAT